MQKLAVVKGICLLAIFLLLGLQTLAYAQETMSAGDKPLSAKKHREFLHRLKKDTAGIGGVMNVGYDAPKGWVPRYTRSECTVRVKVNKNGKVLTVRQWNKFGYRALAVWMFEAPKLGMAASEYQQRTGSVYLLYAKNCDKKYHLTNLMFAQMKNSIIGFPDYDVLHQPVKPSYLTVFICGHWWKDGEQGDCYQNLSSPPKQGDGSNK